MSTLQDVSVSLCTKMYTPGALLGGFGSGRDESCHHEAVTLSCIQLGHLCHTGVRYDVSLIGKKRTQLHLTYHLWLTFRHSAEVLALTTTFIRPRMISLLFTNQNTIVSLKYQKPEHLNLFAVIKVIINYCGHSPVSL